MRTEGMRFIRRRGGIVAALMALTVVVLAFAGTPGAGAASGAPIFVDQGNTTTTGTAICLSSGLCSPFVATAFWAKTDAANGTGLRGSGTGTSGVGVVGQGLEGSAGGTGVFGHGTYGVHGTGTGWGVWGEGDDRGVYGISNNEGVVGFGNAVGVRADSPTIALRVQGKAEFSRSGTATINGTSAAPKSNVVVSGVALSAKSQVLVTVQKNVAGVWVRTAVPNVAGSSVTIYLNKAATTSVPVAWMVIERP